MTQPGITDPFVNFVRDLRNRGLEFVSGRYLGKYPGVVTDTDDPQGQGRVLVICQVATGRDTPLNLWAYPSSPYAGCNKGFYAPPDVGDGVWVWFDHGDVTQPRFSGSFWSNPQLVRTKATSQIPAEFRKLTAGQVTTRGFRTKGGLGWLFEDDNTLPLGRRFELWTGLQPTGDPDGAAERHHQLTMTDIPGGEKIEVASNGGQATQWIDIAGQLAIRNTTVGGLFVNLLDYIQKIVLGGPLGFTVSIDEGTGKRIEARTPLGLFARLLEAAKVIESGGPLGFKFTIDEQSGSITLETPLGKKLKIDEAGSSIIVTDEAANSITITPTGIIVDSKTLVNIQALAALQMSAGAAASLIAQGAVAIKGLGIAIESTGAAPMSTIAGGVSNNTFAGLVSEQFLGALTWAISGLWQVGASIVNITSPNIQLGTGGANFFLVDERFLTLYNAHTHLSDVPAAPTGPPLVPAVIAAQTTTAVKAN